MLCFIGPQKYVLYNVEQALFDRALSMVLASLFLSPLKIN